MPYFLYVRYCMHVVVDDEHMHQKAIPYLINILFHNVELKSVSSHKFIDNAASYGI
jgi:hypothetical protein